MKKTLGKTGSADEINERWNEVLNLLDEIAIEYTKELQAETGIYYLKRGKMRFDIWQFPPCRLSAIRNRTLPSFHNFFSSDLHTTGLWEQLNRNDNLLHDRHVVGNDPRYGCKSTFNEINQIFATET
jgi:hypothetical protein